MKLRKALSKNLRRIMKERGYSQQGLQQITGVSQSQISSYLRTEKAATIDSLEALAKGLNISVFELLTDSKTERR